MARCHSTSLVLWSPTEILSGHYGLYWDCTEYRWARLQTAERLEAQLNTASLRFAWTTIHGSFTRATVSLAHQPLRNKA